MAWVYGATIEFRTIWAARDMGERMAGLTFSFTDGELCKVGSSSSAHAEDTQREGDWWLDLVPSNVTRSGISNEKEALHAIEFASICYGFLRNEKHFRFATVGVEAFQFRTHAELLAVLAKLNDFSLWPGLVVSADMLANAHPDNRRLFVPFSDTHLWIPYDNHDLKEYHKRCNGA
jgi:hypothetical protein